MLFDGSHRGVFLKYRLFSGFRWFKYSVAIKLRNRRKQAEILETKRDALPEIWQSGDVGLILRACDGVLYSFGFSLLAIFVLMQWLKKWSFFPFVLYRVALGTALLLDAYGIYDVKALFA